ncbi:MAG: YicC/YloC family endoribonuclease [Planctomycetota bacterium]
MTGFGRATKRIDGAMCVVEVRSVNNRFLKISIHGPEGGPLDEGWIHEAVRGAVRRGTVQVDLRQEGRFREHAVVDRAAVREYLAVWRGLKRELGIPGDLTVEVLAGLPGVYARRGGAGLVPAVWEPLLRKAVEGFRTMRLAEGRAVAASCARRLGAMEKGLARLRKNLPALLAAQRNRLDERIKALLVGSGVSIPPETILREAALLAERSDAAEEMERLEKHIAAFRKRLERDAPEEAKGLEFISQEMLREANTLGSKSSDYDVTREAIALKEEIERIREQLQNVE